jgi:hypothetical protein
MKFSPRQFAIPGLLLAFVLLAGWYSCAIPLGEGPDVPGHAEFALFVAREGRLPDQRLREVPGEGHQPPLAYWLLQPAARAVPLAERRVILASNPRWIWAGGEQAAAFGWRSVDRWPYRGDVLAWHLMRLVAVLCGAITVLLTFGIGRRLGLGWWTAFGGMALLALWPQFIFHSALVSNDPLLWTLTAATLWLLLAPDPGRWWPWQIGLAVGAALLTKQSGIILLPLVVLALFVRRRGMAGVIVRRRGSLGAETGFGRTARVWDTELLRWLLKIGLTVALVAGWWYARNLALYGDVFGLAAYKGEFASPTFSPLSLADWREALRLLSTSLVARFGWMNVPAPLWVYWVAAGVVAGALLGFGRSKGHDQPASPLAPIAYGLVPLALAWTLLFALLSGQVGWQGRFVLPAAPVLALGLAAGQARLIRGYLGIALALAALAATVLALPAAMIAPAYPYLVVAPQPERPLLARFVPDYTPPLELRGLDLPATAQRGQPVRIGTLWHALGPQDRDWTLFIHLAQPGVSDELFSFDIQPQRCDWPARRWTTDDWWEDTTTFSLPADLPPGPYVVRMGWFDERDGTRMALRSVDGVLLGDYASLGSIVVQP